MGKHVEENRAPTLLPLDENEQMNDLKPPPEEEIEWVFNGYGEDLLRAMRDQELMRVQGLIIGGADCAFVESSGTTIAHLACLRGAVGIVRMITEHKGKLNSQDKIFEVTPMHIAASRGDMYSIHHLLKGRADPNLVSVEGDTPLSRAAGKGNLKIIKKLLSDENIKPDLTSRETKNYWEKDEEQAELELKNKLEDDLINKGHTALMTYKQTSGPAAETAGEAIRRGRTNSKRSEKKKLRRRVLSPEERAHFLKETMNLYRRERRAPMSPLLKAVKRNQNIEVVKALLEAKLKPNRVDEKQNAPLHCAAHFANAPTCRALLQAGADPRATNDSQRTPLHFAARNGAVRVVKMLIESGGDVNAKDENGQTPLGLAGDSQVRKLLIAKGAIDPGLPRDTCRISAPVSPDRSPDNSPERNGDRNTKKLTAAVHGENTL